MRQVRLNYINDLIINYIVLTVCLLMVVLFVGCSSFTYSYKQRNPENKQDIKENISFQDLLVSSSREGVDIKTDNARIRIGESQTKPDSESIKAITEGVVEAVAK